MLAHHSRARFIARRSQTLRRRRLCGLCLSWTFILYLLYRCLGYLTSSSNSSSIITTTRPEQTTSEELRPIHAIVVETAPLDISSSGPRLNNNNRYNEILTDCLEYPKCDRITHLPTSLVGKRCEFDVTNDTQYLPEPSLVRCLRRATRTRWQVDSSRYEQHVKILQNPSSCDAPLSSLEDRQWHVVKFTSHGHGVNAFYMATNVGNHWDRGVPVLASFSAYRFGSHVEKCNGKDYVHRGWPCHMSPLSENCDLHDELALKATVNMNKMHEGHPSKDWCVPNGEYKREFGRCRCREGYLPSEEGTHCLNFETDETFKDKRKWKPRYEKYHRSKHSNNHEEQHLDLDGEDDYAMTGTEHWISRLAPGEVFPLENHDDPAHFSLRHFNSRYPQKHPSKLKLKYGFFWWMLQNIWILHRDAPKRQEMENRVRALLGDSTECVAVHVRRGDSCDDPTARHRTCPELSVYAKHVREMKQKYFDGNNNQQFEGRKFKVFLASDDPSAIEEAKQLNMENNGMEWTWQRIDRKRYVNGKVVDNNPALFSDTAMDELYFDLWAISFCQIGFVASFASSVAWNGYGLAVGRYKYYVPFVSVDWPWGHKILGGHHAKNNVFDSTLDQRDLSERMKLFD